MKVLRALAVCGLAVLCTARCESRGDGIRKGGGNGDGRMQGALHAAANGAKKTLPVPLHPITPPAGDVLAGFRHTLANSLFWHGTTTPQLSDDGLSKKYVGEFGAFVEWSNGFSLGLPNANSPSITAGPLSQSSAVHTDRVLSYFKGAGIPADQIGEVRLTTLMQRGGDSTGETFSNLVGFTTILTRKIDGVRVEGSFAWAQFNANNVVVAEQVWWPELPSSLLTKTQALRQTFASAAQEAVYRAKLPPEVATAKGEVVLHHAPPLAVDWFSDVTFDIQGEAGTVRAFDSASAEVIYASRLLPTPPPSMPR